LPWQTRWIWRQGILNNGSWEYGTFSLYVTEILFLIIFFFGLVSIIGKRKNKDKAKEDSTGFSFYILIFVLALASFISTFWAADYLLAIYAFTKLMEGIALLALVIRIQFSLKKLAYTLVAAALVQSILAFWQSFSQSIIGTKWLGMSEQFSFLGGASVVESAAGRWLRAYGSLPHPNILGGFLAISLIMLFGLAFVTEKRAERYFVLISSIIINAALFLSFSRESWIGYFLALIFLSYIIFRGKNQRLKIIFSDLFIITLIVGAIFSIVLRNEFLTRSLASGRLETKSTEERISYSSEAYELINNNLSSNTDWYKGAGIGNYTVALYKLNNQMNSWDYQPVHNLYLLLFTELGVGGIIVILFLILKIFKDIKIRKLAGERKIIISANKLYISDIVSLANKFDYWFLIFSAILIEIGIISLFDHYFWTLYVGSILLWLFLGLWLKNFRADINNFK
jgi:hypothetical protein